MAADAVAQLDHQQPCYWLCKLDKVCFLQGGRWGVGGVGGGGGGGGGGVSNASHIPDIDRYLCFINPW